MPGVLVRIGTWPIPDGAGDAGGVKAGEGLGTLVGSGGAALTWDSVPVAGRVWLVH